MTETSAVTGELKKKLLTANVEKARNIAKKIVSDCTELKSKCSKPYMEWEECGLGHGDGVNVTKRIGETAQL